MKIIAVVAQKGGVGKTTVTQCLAVEALRQGLATAIIDADPQRSATERGEQREAVQIDAPPVLPLGSKSLGSLIADLKKRGAAFVVIDTPPHSAPAINAALDVSTGAVMVTRPNTTWAEAAAMGVSPRSRVAQPTDLLTLGLSGLGSYVGTQRSLIYCFDYQKFNLPR